MNNAGVPRASETQQIAFLADIHLHDIYAAPDSSNEKYEWPVDGNNGRHLLIRSMRAQLRSTRLFNENYFVVRAALDDIAARGIHLVAVPGDFSDDGQPANVRAFARLLDEYRHRHGIRFFVITGNHDPVRPYATPGGKPDFLSASGSEIAVYSRNHPSCSSADSQTVACDDALAQWGYEEIMHTLSRHGFAKDTQDKWYETPFPQRGFDWCHEASVNECVWMPDASYLVEPVAGLWLLAIDANVYVPAWQRGVDGSMEFAGSSNAGYDLMRRFKQPVLDWVADVVRRAEQQGKQLVAFSHFPMTGFHDEADPDIRALVGEDVLQSRRIPSLSVTQALAHSGLRLHFAGHMHLNDLAQVRAQDGGRLVNVQVPSLAAYRPAYTLLQLEPSGRARVRTVAVDRVPGFGRLFAHYRRERQHLSDSGQKPWDTSILAAKSYLTFTEMHLRALVEDRYLPQWPKPLVALLGTHNIGAALEKAGCNPAQLAGGIPNQIAKLKGQELIHDVYRLRNAGPLARIPTQRRRWYVRLAGSVENCGTDTAGHNVANLLVVLSRLAAPEADDFQMDLHSGQLSPPDQRTVK
ncbi:metallophosphoesterase family protein [Microbulbifer elongatus]|uniref:metallophosphoesterase family protein n=1 Tax=Microbulbifer elongatus TaxID=86173 RepID=UPI001E47D92E|nr:metallophosphoesterase [Microbulbifer elongatus]